MSWLRLRTLPYRLLRAVRLSPAVHWRLAELVNARFLVGVSGVIMDEQQRLLLFHHTYRRHWPWGLPGGWMARGETPLRGLEREVLEESGLLIQAERLLVIDVCPDKPKLEFMVSGRYLSGSFRPSPEVDAIRWVARDQLPPLLQSQQRLLRRLASLGPHELGWSSTPWKFSDELE